MHTHLIAALLALAWPMGAMAAGAHDHSHGPVMNSAIGQPGDAAKVTRTVEVTLHDDMRFKPDTIQVKQGETIRFFVRNQGAVQHEMVLGTMAELKEHAEMMRTMPDMKHSAPASAAAWCGTSPRPARWISPAPCPATWKPAWSAR